MDVRLVKGKKNAKKKKGEEKICNHKVAHALSICLFFEQMFPLYLFRHIFTYMRLIYFLLHVAYGKGFAEQIMLLCTSVWFLTVLIHHSLCLRFCEKQIHSCCFFVHFFVYVLCSTLAMQISLLWHNILAGLLGNVPNVHANRPLAIAELVKMLFLIFLWLVFFFFLRHSQGIENRTCCRLDSNPFFPHEHQGSVRLEL